MSSKTHTRRSSTSSFGPFPVLRPVPGHTTVAKVRTDAEDKLWAALHARPNSTAADLAEAAEIGRSTAQKLLVKWASDGSLTRTVGIAKGGRRAPDLWAITEADTGPTEADPAPACDVDVADTAQPGPTAPMAQNTSDTRDATPTDDDPTDTTPTNTETRTAETTSTAMTGPVGEGPATDDLATGTVGITEDGSQSVDRRSITAKDRPSGEDRSAEDDPTGTQPALRDHPVTADQPLGTADETQTDAGSKGGRLASGALRGLVEDYLREHSGQDVSPNTVGRALNRSAGAVHNALEKLVAGGYVVRTSDKPKKYAIAPDSTGSDASR